MQELDVWERFEWRKFESFISGHVNRMVCQGEKKYEQIERVVLLSIIRCVAERLVWFGYPESIARNQIYDCIEQAFFYHSKSQQKECWGI